jgi:drug/metabolite transporter (DMT)-like permease
MLDRKTVLGNAAGIVCMLVWAANFPLAVSVLKSWDALGLAPVRMLLAGATVFLATLVMRQMTSFAGLLRSARFLVCSVVFGVSALLFVVAQSRIDAVAGAVIVCSMPLFSALMGWAEGVEKPGLKLVAAIALTVAGGVLTSLVSAQGSGSEGSLAGVAAMLGAVITYVWYSRELVLRFGDAPDLAKTSASMLVAGLTCLVIAVAVVAVTGDVPRYDLSGATLAKIVLLACVTVGLSAVLWLWTGRMVGVTVAAMHHNLVPFYVILLASAGGAVVTGQHLVGALLVIAGAVIAQLRPRRSKAGVTQPVPAGRKPQA